MADLGPLWGTPAGRIAAGQQDLEGALALSTVDTQAAHSRLYAAQAEKFETEARENQQLMALMQRRAAQALPGEQGTELSMSEQLMRLSADALAAGLPTRAAAIAKDASLVGQREASAASSASTTRLNNIKIIRDRAELNGQLFGGATDQKTWEQAGRLWEFQTGLPNPYEGVPFSKDLAARINSAALSTKERLTLEEQELSRKGLERFRNKRLGQHDQEIEIRKAQQKLRETREARLAKAGGGKAVSSPTTAEVSQAKNLVRRDFPGLEGNDLNEAVYSIAAEARALRQANPALDASVALQQAYNNARAGGDFEAVPPRRVLGMDIPGTGGGTRYRGAMRGVEPLPMAQGIVNKGALVKDKYYQGAGGVIGRWTGTGFEIGVPGSGRSLSSNNGGSEPDPDDEEEE